MKLKVVRADPAGNITLFVLSPVEQKMRAPLAEKLLAIPEFAAEQVGYRLPPEDGADGYLYMAGGEFCGNASRAYGMLLAKENKINGRVELTLKVSGSDRPVPVEADTRRGTARAGMPLPRSVTGAEAGGAAGRLVHLGGIAHFVVAGVEPSLDYFEAAEREIFAPMKDLDAYGVMFWDEKSRKLTPLVKVPSANSLYWEGSCGSGSLATVIALTEGEPDGLYAMDLVQPAGCVLAEVQRESGKVTAAWIGGKVTIDPSVELDI